MKGWRETRSAFQELAPVWYCDGGKMARAWPSHRAGRFNSRRSKLTSWRQARMKKMLWGGHTPLNCTGRAKPSRKEHCSRARWWQIRIWIPHLPPACTPQTHQSTDRHPSALWQRKKKKEVKQGEWKRGGMAVSYFEGSIRGEAKANFF